MSDLHLTDYSGEREESTETNESAESTVENSAYTLSNNVVEDLVKYTRSKTVKNERQFVLTTLGYLSGFMKEPSHFVCGCLIGTAGSGKSHLQNTVEDLFPEDYLYYATSGSDKSIIYDESWDEAYVGSLDELQKPSDELIEVLKGIHGGEDDKFHYNVTGGGKGADRDVDLIVREANPYWFLYAQYDPDFEMWDRLLKVPVHESRKKNDAVARMQWDHSMIGFDDDNSEYIYDFDEGEVRIREHIVDMPKNARVKIPAGEEEFGWNAYKYAKPAFDIDRSETNRVSNMLAGLVRSSALLNHENREKRTLHIPNIGKVRGVIIASEQDVANVLSCRDVLLATTHQLDDKRKAICLAITEVGGSEQAAPIKHPDDKEGDPQSIMGYMRQTDASFVKRSQIEAMLEDLEDNGLVEKIEGAGDGNRDLYQFQSWQSLGKFEINEDFKQTFADCTDPFTGKPFVERARELNEEMTPSASDLMSDGTVVSSSGDSKGQATLGGEVIDEPDIDLAPHEELVRDMVADNLGGEVIDGLDEHDPTPREMLGLVPIGEPDDSVEPDGTILDPSHEVWQHGPDKWVTSTNAAEEEIENTMRRLVSEGVVRTIVEEERAGSPLKIRVEVEDGSAE